MNLNRETRRLFALQYLNRENSDDLVEWAKLSLEAGSDGKNLRILAGLSSPAYISEAQDYFRRSLKELGLGVPPAKQDINEYNREVVQCLCEYCIDIAEDILSQRVTPSVGSREIYKTAMFLLQETDEPLPTWLNRWICIEDELDPDTYEFLTQTKYEQAVRREAQSLLHSRRANEDKTNL